MPFASLQGKKKQLASRLLINEEQNVLGGDNLKRHFRTEQNLYDCEEMEINCKVSEHMKRGIRKAALRLQ